MSNSIQSGQLAHYTWIIDEIMVEESSEVSAYKKPFEKTENKNGIQISALNNDLAEELIGLLGTLVGLNFNIVNVPSKQRLQFTRTKDPVTKKALKRLNANQKILADSAYITGSYQNSDVFVPDPLVG